jgi:signal transduction histidine kinase
MRSLTLKLILAFLAVSLLGTALVALLVDWQTQRQFDALVANLYQDDLTTLSDRLAAYYQQQGSWTGIQAVALRNQVPGHGMGGPNNWLPVTLVDSDRIVVLGNGRYQAGDQLSRWAVRRGLPIDVNDQRVGYVVLDLPAGGPSRNSAEGTFLLGVRRATILSAISAAATALLLGALLARTISQPVSELREATEIVARGKLGHQVRVRSQDEIGQLATSFNQMSADLAQATETRRQMTADIAHDLRTPLSVLQGYTEALDEGKLSGNPETYRAMHGQVRHLTRLIEDLRTLSLADAGQLPLQRVAVDPRALLEHSALAYAAQASQQGVNLRVAAGPELPAVAVDADRMAQVLGNLIGNALRYTPAGGEIVLAAEATADAVLLTVHDTGRGIAGEDLPHIFDRFYRADRSRPDTGESGLGLAIARSIVEAHGGRIAAESTPGTGTTFTITLPAV